MSFFQLHETDKACLPQIYLSNALCGTFYRTNIILFHRNTCLLYYYSTANHGSVHVRLKLRQTSFKTTLSYHFYRVELFCLSFFVKYLTRITLVWSHIFYFIFIRLLFYFEHNKSIKRWMFRIFLIGKWNSELKIFSLFIY